MHAAVLVVVQQVTDLLKECSNITTPDQYLVNQPANTMLVHQLCLTQVTL
jgi:hypothetical protein